MSSHKFLSWLSCHGVTDTTHSSSANVFLSWCPAVTVSTSFGRDCWPHKRQDLFDDLKRLFLNVPSDHVLVFFFNQLDYDLCTLAVSLMLSLAVHATRSPSCSPPARSDFLRITSLLRPKRGRLCLRQSTLVMDNRSQLCSCHDLRLSVSNLKYCKPTLIQRLSELKELIIHMYTFLHSWHIGNAIPYCKQTHIIIRIA